jgi:hypothetical protein
VAEVRQIQREGLYFQYPQHIIPLIVSGCLTVAVPFEPQQDYVFGRCNPYGLVSLYQGKLLRPLRHQRIKCGTARQHDIHFDQAREMQETEGAQLRNGITQCLCINSIGCFVIVS